VEVGVPRQESPRPHGSSRNRPAIRAARAPMFASPHAISTLNSVQLTREYRHVCQEIRGSFTSRHHQI
jgi:hypothetical protein